MARQEVLLHHFPEKFALLDSLKVPWIYTCNYKFTPPLNNFRIIILDIENCCEKYAQYVCIDYYSSSSYICTYVNSLTKMKKQFTVRFTYRFVDRFGTCTIRLSIKQIVLSRQCNKCSKIISVAGGYTHIQTLCSHVIILLNAYMRMNLRRQSILCYDILLLYWTCNNLTNPYHVEDHVKIAFRKC